MESAGKRLVLRFTIRRIGRGKRPVEVAHFYSPYGGKVFHAYCERGVVSSFIERIIYTFNSNVERSRTGKSIYLEGGKAEDIFRRLVILAGCTQSVRIRTKIVEVAESVAGLGEVETIFWYNKMLEEYEKRGYWGACRVAKAFRVIYRID